MAQPGDQQWSRTAVMIFPSPFRHIVGSNSNETRTAALHVHCKPLLTRLSTYHSTPSKPIYWRQKINHKRHIQLFRFICSLSGPTVQICVAVLQCVAVNWIVNKRASAVNNNNNNNNMTRKFTDNRGAIPSESAPQKTKQQRLTVGFIMLFIVQMKISTPSENLSKTKRLEGIKI